MLNLLSLKVVDWRSKKEQVMGQIDLVMGLCEA